VENSTPLIHCFFGWSKGGIRNSKFLPKGAKDDDGELKNRKRIIWDKTQHGKGVNNIPKGQKYEIKTKEKDIHSTTLTGRKWGRGGIGGGRGGKRKGGRRKSPTYVTFFQNEKQTTYATKADFGEKAGLRKPKKTSTIKPTLEGKK